MRKSALNILTAFSALVNLVLITLFAFWQFNDVKYELIFFLAITNIPFYVVFTRFVSVKNFNLFLLLVLSACIALGSVICSSYLFEFTETILKKGVSHFDDIFFALMGALFYIPYVLIYWFNEVTLYCILAGILNTYFMYKAGKLTDNS